MSRRTLVVVAALLVGIAACQGEGNGGGSTTSPSTVATPANAPKPTPTTTTPPVATSVSTISVAHDEPPPQPAATATAVAVATPGQPGAQPTPALSFSVVPAPGVTRAEDGSGAVVAANDPVFLDVRGGVGGQALGPELSVGQLRFRDHRYPSPGVVRFTCASKSLLTSGAEVALVYGSKRIVVSTSLVVP